MNLGAARLEIIVPDGLESSLVSLGAARLEINVPDGLESSLVNLGAVLRLFYLMALRPPW